MKAVNDMVETVVSHLGSVTQSGAVVGEPITLGGLTLIILSRISVGMGAGGGEGEGQPMVGKKGARRGRGRGGGEGAGGGAKVRPAAVIVFAEDGVRVMPIPDKPGFFDKLADRIPDVVDMVDKIRGGVSGSAPAREAA